MRKRTGKNGIWKSTLREIRQSFGRFAAIFAIVAMGVGFFAGLKVTRSAMVETTQAYLEKNGFFDYRLLSTLGFQEEDLALLRAQEDIRAAEGSVTADILYNTDHGGSGVVKAHSLSKEINTVKVLAGRLPENAGECVADANLFGTDSIGEIIYLAQENEQEDLDFFACSEYVIVGVVQSPYYLQYERGNTSLGNGRVNGFIYLLPEGFDVDYYTEIFVKFDENFELYSDAYEDYLADKKPLWEDLTALSGEQRYTRLVEEIDGEIRDGEAELAKERADAEKELADAKEELEDAAAELADAKEELEDGRRKVEDGKKELADGERKIAESEKKLADARKELADGEKEIADGEKELADAWEEWEFESKRFDKETEPLKDAQAQLDAQSAAISQSEAQLAQGEAQAAAGQAQLDDARQAAEAGFAQGESALLQALQDLEGIKDILGDQAYNEKLVELQTQLQFLEGQKQEADRQFAVEQAKLDAAKQEIEVNRQKIDEGKKALAAANAQLAEGMAKADEGKRQLNAAYMQIQDAEAELEKGKKELEDGRAELADGEKQLADARKELADAGNELADAENELAEGEKEYQDGLLKYQDGLQEYEEGLAEFETEIADAEAELADARKELADLEAPDTYVLGRDTNVGYVCFENDSAIVDGIANIFPIFFFLVAALVCSTTMNRMVEEQRTLIGTLKALGYSKGIIMSKYLFYAGSAALTGCFIGFFGGTWLFPRVIWSAYGIMYRVESLVYVFDWGLAVISLAAALLCTMGTTWLTCRHELSQTAADLMRPKSPKAGKRVFLEKIPFIWRRLGFLKKVSVRNIFRYKKRLFMMVIGISGCTALLVTGFGVKDSIAHIASQQFSEIQTYDMGITLTDAVTEEIKEDLRQTSGQELIEMMPVLETTLDIVTESGRKSVNLVAADSSEDISSYLNLHTEKKEPLDFPEKGQAVVTSRVAEELGIEVGDTILLQEEDGSSILAAVSGISRNFIYNYVYICADTYAEQMNREPELKSVWMNISEGREAHEISAALMQLDLVSNVTINADTQERFSSMMKSMDLIVAVIILCAGGLAFIVLYNLTNINITERVREIATIKVLGFYKNETAAYVFRENTLLALMGALTGLPLGCLLHRFVMDRVRIDMVSFDTLVTPLSYFLSGVLTMIFAWLINRLMRGKLKSVSMTESLKSVD